MLQSWGWGGQGFQRDPSPGNFFGTWDLIITPFTLHQFLGSSSKGLIVVMVQHCNKQVRLTIISMNMVEYPMSIIILCYSETMGGPQDFSVIPLLSPWYHLVRFQHLLGLKWLGKDLGGASGLVLDNKVKVDSHISLLKREDLSRLPACLSPNKSIIYN